MFGVREAQREVEHDEISTAWGLLLSWHTAQLTQWHRHCQVGKKRNKLFPSPPCQPAHSLLVEHKYLIDKIYTIHKHISRESEMMCRQFYIYAELDILCKQLKRIHYSLATLDEMLCSRSDFILLWISILRLDLDIWCFTITHLTLTYFFLCFFHPAKWKHPPPHQQRS